MNEKEKWKRNAMLVRLMFDMSDDCPSLHCPFCVLGKSKDSGIPHMQETVFGRVEHSTSGPGLIIKFG